MSNRKHTERRLRDALDLTKYLCAVIKEKDERIGQLEAALAKAQDIMRILPKIERRLVALDEGNTERLSAVEKFEKATKARLKQVRSGVVEMIPHAKRGKKVVLSASLGGRARAATLYEPDRENYRRALAEYIRLNPSVSLTRARTRIADRFNVSRRTIERNTMDVGEARRGGSAT